MEQLGYTLIVGSGFVGLLSLVLSWLWHRLDLELPDPGEREEPWSPEQWAQYHNRALFMRRIQQVGILSMYLSLVGAVVGFILIGWAGLQS